MSKIVPKTCLKRVFRPKYGVKNGLKFIKLPFLTKNTQKWPKIPVFLQLLKNTIWPGERRFFARVLKSNQQIHLGGGHSRFFVKNLNRNSAFSRANRIWKSPKNRKVGVRDQSPKSGFFQKWPQNLSSSDFWPRCFFQNFFKIGRLVI